MSSFKLAVGTLIFGALSFSAGRFFTSPRIETREVDKIVYRERAEIKTDTDRTVDKKETIKPDGTRIIETLSTTKRTTDKKSDTSLNKETERYTLTETRKDWHVTLTYLPVLPGYQDSKYTLDIQRRIFSEIYLGASVSTDKTIGLSLGMGF